jgi:hypothetical protein
MKRFLSLLLVAALVLSVPVAPVFAQTNTTTQKENVTQLVVAAQIGDLPHKFVFHKHLLQIPIYRSVFFNTG